MKDDSRRGLLVTFEGVEGSGKSTQIRLLAESLTASGREVLSSREPGATALGRELRRLLLDPGFSPDVLTELMLYLADRRQHCRQLLAPAIQRGAIVLVDRFIDSTWVYQGYASEPGNLALIAELNRLTVGDLWPDLTFLLDCPAAIGLERARQRNRETGAVGVADRFEQRQLEFHEQVRRGFLELAAAEPGRFRVLAGDREAKSIHREITREFKEFYAAC